MLFSRLNALNCQESIEYFLSLSLFLQDWSISNLPSTCPMAFKQSLSVLYNICTFVPLYSLQQFLPLTPSLILKSHPFSRISFKCHLLHIFFNLLNEGNIPSFKCPKDICFLPLSWPMHPFIFPHVAAIYISELVFLPMKAMVVSPL